MYIPVAEPDLSELERRYLLDAFDVERFISSSGKYIGMFEERMATIFGRAYALAVSNGTTALHLALMALGVGVGDEVVVPAFTFAATAASVIHCGATPVFVDCREDDLTIDITQLEAVYTSRTKAIIAVDVYGVPCDYDPLIAWCAEHNVFLIEDAAEAHGARYKGRPVGSFGDISCFSFYGNKILTTGEGGLCVTDNEVLYKKMTLLRNHGMATPGVYDHDVVGYNYRMTNLQAAIGLGQAERIQELLAKRKQIHAWYREGLSGLPIVFLRNHDDKEAVYWLNNILLQRHDVAHVREALRQADIGSRPFFTPLHMVAAYSLYAQQDQRFIRSEAAAGRGVSLPSSSLLTKEQVDRVCQVLRNILL